jgi:predicted tellurium resistance membrane protein TerC
MTEIISQQALTAFFQVVMIDLVLAGDNAIVIGLAAAGLPQSQRNKAILVGIIAATILRIGFASITVQLLQIIGLLLAGGILLLWVCWKMWRELHTSPVHDDIGEALNGQHGHPCCTVTGRPRKTLGPVDSKDSLLSANQIQGCFWGGGLGCDGSFGFERCCLGADGAPDYWSA